MADLRMFVQRQMIAQQADVMAQQKTGTAAEGARQGLLSAPQKTVVHNNHIRTGGMGLFKQLQPRRYAKHNFAHAGTPFHLQAVMAAVRNFGTVQIFV